MGLRDFGHAFYLQNLQAFALLLLLSAPAWATADLVVQVDSSSAATVTLEAPDGSTQSATDDDGDGVIVLEPARGGEYQVRITAGDAEASRAVNIPASGVVTLTLTDSGEIHAAYTAAFEDDEIVVTARRREEGIQEIPVAITAMNEAVLEARSMRNLRDVGDYAPNVDFSLTGGLSGRSSEATVFIRGVGQIDTAFFFDPGVGIYVDGVYLARSQGSVLDLVDLERVEILRGPQGTLFGKNTTGGAISLVTKKPEGAFSSTLDLAIGEYDRQDGKLRLNGALADKLFASLALSSVNRDGFSKSRASDLELGSDNRDAARVALRYLPTESFILDLTSEYTRDRSTRLDEPLVGLSNPPILEFYNNARNAAGLLPYDERWVSDNLLESYSTFPGINDGDVSSITLTLNWNRDDLALQSISAFRRFDYRGQADADGSPIPFAHPKDAQSQDQVSQEVHLSGTAADGRLRWFGGALYFREYSHTETLVVVLGGLFEALELAPGPIFAPPGVPDFLCNPGPPPPGLPCFGGAGNPLNFAFFVGDGNLTIEEFETDSYAAFGEISYEVSPRLTAALGVRYTLEEKEFIYFNQPGNAPVGRQLTNSDDWDAWSPRFSLSYQASDDTLLYFSASKGFKSGGFNGRPQQQNTLEPFDPEKVIALELGLKTDIAGDRLRLNAAAFHNDYTDIQFFASLLVGNNPVFVVQNAGEAEAKGFELELIARPTDVFHISTSIGYIDAEYTELNNVAPGSATLNGRFPKTPDWNVTFSPAYTFRTSSGDTFTVRADYSYKDKVWNDIANLEFIAQPAYDLWGARLAYAHRSGRWEVALAGTNLGDEQYISHGFFPPAFGPAVIVAGRPREWALTAKLRFGQ